MKFINFESFWIWMIWLVCRWARRDDMLIVTLPCSICITCQCSKEEHEKFFKGFSSSSIRQTCWALIDTDVRFVTFGVFNIIDDKEPSSSNTRCWNIFHVEKINLISDIILNSIIQEFPSASSWVKEWEERENDEKTRKTIKLKQDQKFMDCRLEQHCLSLKLKISPPTEEIG